MLGRFWMEKMPWEGLIDELGSLSDAISCLYGMIEKRRQPKNAQVRPERRSFRKNGSQ